MSFDVDPRDQRKRYLLNHPESDFLFVVWSQALAEKYINEDWCDDVTDVPHWEELYKQQQEMK